MTQQPLDLAPAPAPPSGHRNRFDRRWHLVGAGLSNVWLFGDLQLSARSGRLLLRGPNGTGKTTALEGLCPYLLDLNQQRLGAGKSRVTTLKTLMETGAAGKRRYGYMWLEFGAPGEQEVLSFGVRLQYSQGSSPAITVVPFFVRGRPLEDFALHGPNRAPLTSEEFAGAVAELGGEIFEDPEDYITRLGTHVLRFTPDEIRLLPQRMRQVRNPSLLGDVTPREAADSLRQSLPGVDPDVVDATGKALSESESTRKAFARDSRASDALTDFAAMWGGHVVDVVSRRHADAVRHCKEAARARTKLVAAEAAHRKAKELSASADTAADRLTDQLTDAQARVSAAEQHDDYKAAGRIEDLQKASDAQADTAALETGRLGDRASAIARAGVRVMDAATALSADIDASITAAVTVDANAQPVPPPLTWHTVPRAVITVAEIAADPGPVVRVDGDVDRIVAVAQHWRSLGARHRSRAEQAALALTDHGVVEEADRAAVKAESDHDALVGAAESTTAAAMTAAEAAGSAARALRFAVGRWVRSNADLTPGWSEDTAPTSDDEPAVVLSDAEDLAASTGRRAAENAGRSRTHAVEATAQAHQLREQASDLRVQALGLRDGKLLPLPRPDWAGSGDDNVAFGTALEWRDDIVDGTLRALVESAMAAAGLLGATLVDSAASTSNWTVDAGDTGIPRRSLAEVLAADPNHPSAAIAAGVLDRIEFANTAGDTDSSEATLVIGADGTFRAGVLRGRAPGADDPSEAPAAAHIGARQRRAAALAEANRLDAAADRLEDEAGIRDAEARRLDAEADDFERRAATFPDRNPLARAEADRARLAANAVEALSRADAADQRARALRSEHQREAREWAERTRLAGLPVEPDELHRIQRDGAQAEVTLHAQADHLDKRCSGRLDSLIADALADDRAAAELPTLASRARTAHAEAVATEAKLDHLQRTAGANAQQARREYADAVSAEKQLTKQTTQATTAARARSNDVSSAEAMYGAALEHEASVRPAAALAVEQLRHVLRVPGVPDCLDLEIIASGDPQLLDDVGHAIDGRRTSVRKTVRERYDQARAELAGTWALEPGDGPDDLDTYVLTHEDQTYTPIAAAERARALKARAEGALAAAEESALRDFVVGRLPGAIGVAWQRLHDWTAAVNRKMRTATASSGVGVQVRVRLRDDLSSAARVAYELSCLKSEADRSVTDQQEVGQALQSLLAAANGETMEERVAVAVDIREWVSVHYEVERPGEKPQRWGSRTGLSGGERRLVVLAPMLAAIASSYDRADPATLRLATLDEVPAEVDEEGRTALARYIAELDLDLLSTSYLWDGAPGAWDGIDAHDLEKDVDGTVVAFPMLVRGLLDDEMMPDEQ